MLTILFALILVGVAVWLVDQVVPMPQPFRVVVRLVAVLVVVWLLFRLVVTLPPIG